MIGACFAPNVPWARKSFRTHPIELLGDVGRVESRFSPFGDSVSVGAWFAPFGTVVSEIILDASNGTPR